MQEFIERSSSFRQRAWNPHDPDILAACEILGLDINQARKQFFLRVVAAGEANDEDDASDDGSEDEASEENKAMGNVSPSARTPPEASDVEACHCLQRLDCDSEAAIEMFSRDHLLERSLAELAAKSTPEDAHDLEGVLDSLEGDAVARARLRDMLQDAACYMPHPDPSLQPRPGLGLLGIPV